MADNTRLNLTAPNGARLRCKLYSDDPGADEARQAALDALLAAGFCPTADEPPECAGRRNSTLLREATARVAELEARNEETPDADTDV